MKPGSYHPFGRTVADLLRSDVDPGSLAKLHELSGFRHAVTAVRLVLSVALIAYVTARYSTPWVWVPLGFLQGVHVLGFLILLHDAIHGLVFEKPHPRADRLLAFLYALPAGISALQFSRWHLDHHAELGSNVHDPKRAYLTPKIIRRWFKALYCTPFLFVIYSRASAKEAKSYDPQLRSSIRRERIAVLAVHFLLIGWLASVDAALLWRVYLFPLFFMFPIAFTINRLGQHYDIDPRSPEKWSTRIDGNPIVRFLFLASNHHIEHHYYPGVPLYRMAALNRLLRPFFAARGVENRTYSGLLFDWFVRNKTPHTDWHQNR